MGKKEATVVYDTDEDDGFAAPSETFEEREAAKVEAARLKREQEKKEKEAKAAQAKAARLAEQQKQKAAKQSAKGDSKGAGVVTSQPVMNAAFGGAAIGGAAVGGVAIVAVGAAEGGGQGGSAGPPEGVRRRLALPKGFKGDNPPPIFIDNPIEGAIGTESPFGPSLVTQHTIKQEKVGFLCCSRPFAVPHEYAVAQGPANDFADVLVTGKFNHKEICGCCGLCRVMPPCPIVGKGCYKDASNFVFETEDKTFTVSRDGSSGKGEIFNVKDGNQVVASAAENSMTACEKAIKLLTSDRFTEYPIELRDANGQAVLTKRVEYMGCAGICKSAVSCKCVECCNSIGKCGGACGCPEMVCKPDCGEVVCPSCCPGKEKKEKEKKPSCCSPEGCKTCCGVIEYDDEEKMEVTCFGFCGKSGPCAQKLGCCLPGPCGGSCCKGGCATISWMEPIDLPVEEWYGNKADESGEFVATISHHMNIEFTQKYGCMRSQKVSPIYHSNVAMPSAYGREYGTAEWQAILGWLGFEWHVPVNASFY